MYRDAELEMNFPSSAVDEVDSTSDEHGHPAPSTSAQMDQSQSSHALPFQRFARAQNDATELELSLINGSEAEAAALKQVCALQRHGASILLSGVR